MKDGKMVLIAYHLLESSIGAYIEWLVNELTMTANKIKYKDAHLIMFPQMQKPTSQISLAYPWSLLFFSYRVSLAEYNRVLRVLSPVAGDRRILRADSCAWKPPGGLREDSFHATTVVFIYNPHERFL